MVVHKNNNGRLQLEVIKIAQNMPPRPRTARSIERAGAARSPDLSIDPPKFLASMLPPPPMAVRLDIQRGVVSLMKQRGRNAETRTGLAQDAREGHMTLTKAVAVRASTAESPEAMEAARHLVRRRYAWRGYDSPEQQDAALDTPAGHPAREITFVATDDDATVGTVTLGLDGPSGLLAEGTHRDAVHKQRAAGRNVCELTRLAVAERADSKSVLAALFSLAYAAGSVHGVTDLFIEVNPRHVGFYTRVLGFVVAAGEKLCERVRAPSVLLWLEIDQLEIRLGKLNVELAPMPYAARAA